MKTKIARTIAALQRKADCPAATPAEREAALKAIEKLSTREETPPFCLNDFAFLQVLDGISKEQVERFTALVIDAYGGKIQPATAYNQIVARAMRDRCDFLGAAVCIIVDARSAKIDREMLARRRAHR